MPRCMLKCIRAFLSEVLIATNLMLSGEFTPIFLFNSEYWLHHCWKYGIIHLLVSEFHISEMLVYPIMYVPEVCPSSGVFCSSAFFP